MTLTKTATDPGAEAEHVPSGLPNPEADVHHPTGWLYWRLIMYMIIVGLSLGLYGYDNAFAAPLVQLPLFIEKYQGPGLTLTARNLDLLVTVPLVGAAFGTFAAAPIMERFGRKVALIAAYSLLCVPGSFLQLFAPNLAAMICGRLWNYIGISILTTTTPLYLAEFVPAHVRGRAIGFCVAGIAAVGVLSTVIVWACEKNNHKRQYMIPLAVQAACPVVLGLLTLLVPESPAWYVKLGKEDAARNVLMSLRNNKAHIGDAELRMFQQALTTEAERTHNIHFWHILNRENLERTLTAGALLSTAQVGGQILVGTYSTVILVQSGVGNPFQITIIITCLQFLGTIVGPPLVDRVGRRPVALVGFTILLFLNLAAGSLAAAGLTTERQRLALASVFIVFAFFNAVSFQSLSLVLPTEIAGPSLRGPTMSWSVFWSYVTAVITTFAVPQLMNADAANLGAKTAFIFAGCIFVTLIWAYFYIPETRARTVAEIQEMYQIGLPKRKWRDYTCNVEQQSSQSPKLSA